MRASIGGFKPTSARLVRQIIWRDIAQAPRDGRMIEVLREHERGWPKRTRWAGGQWEGGYKPTHWRTIQRVGSQWRG
jgi:hypothetical protein